MIASLCPSVSIKSTPIQNCNPLTKRTQGRFHRIKMASIASYNRLKCIAAIIQLEDVQKEMLLLDHATQAADDKILLALLGKHNIVSRTMCMYSYKQRARYKLIYFLIILCASIGSGAAQAPTLATLDLLAKCFDSSARLNPTIDVVPIFPFLLESLAGKKS
jgi:hypothetical protein